MSLILSFLLVRQRHAKIPFYAQNPITISMMHPPKHLLGRKPKFSTPFLPLTLLLFEFRTPSFMCCLSTGFQDVGIDILYVQNILIYLGWLWLKQNFLERLLVLCDALDRKLALVHLGLIVDQFMAPRL